MRAPGWWLNRRVSNRVCGLDTVLLDIGPPEMLALAARLVRARLGARIPGFGDNDMPRKIIACAEGGLCEHVPSEVSC
jgi:hypothetical protein